MLVLAGLLIALSCEECTSVKTHNKTEMFVDIETDESDTWIGCSTIDPKAEITLMTFYLLAGDTTHEFMFRRVDDLDWCLKTQKKYRDLTKDVKKVRIAGISPNNQTKLITDRIPEKFKKSPRKINWTFVRLQTEKGCESYFSKDCNPENYWAGTTPPN